MYLDDCVCVLPDLTWLPLLGVGRKSWYIIITLIVCMSINWWHAYDPTAMHVSHIWSYANACIHIWSYANAYMPYMIIWQCMYAIYDHMTMHRCHIWSYDNACMPYMIILQCNFEYMIIYKVVFSYLIIYKVISDNIHMMSYLIQCMTNYHIYTI